MGAGHAALSVLRRPWLPALVLAAAGTLYALAFEPLPAALTAPPWSRALFARDGTLLDVSIASDEQWRLPLATERVPARYASALIAFEDHRFRWHPGIDPLAVLRALRANLRAGRVVSGASTVTMQVARLALGNPPRTLSNKLRELRLAFALEWRFGKDEILALYATHAPYGGNLVGLHAASRAWFGRAPDELSWGEAALLAVLPNSPALLHPGRNRALLEAKRNRLLERLHARGELDDDDLLLARREPLPAARLRWPQSAPHLLQRLSAGQPDRALHHSTLDARLQHDMQQLAERQLPQLAAEGVRNLALLVVDHDSRETLAYVGNATLDRASGGDVDIAARARSTGSILKPLLYGAMLQDGELTPAQLVPDVPGNFGGYAPQNFDLEFRGAVPAHEVLAQSLNVPSVRLLRRYGVGRFRARLQQFGLGGITRSAENYGLSLILGGAEASLWELTGVFANLTRAAAHPGETPLALPLRLRPAAPAGAEPARDLPRAARPFPLDAGAAWLTLQAMLDVVRPGGDMYWRDYEGSQAIAWKTGTSFGLRDGWAIGSNGRYTVGVWTGNADGSPAATLGGARSAGPILLQAFARLGNAAWIARPALALKTVAVCADDGYLAANDCVTRAIALPAGSHFALPSPYHKRVFLAPGGRFRVHAGCERPGRMEARDWFVLPPAMEYFWRRNHADYRVLPPWRADCIAGLRQYADERAFDLIYPSADSELFIPLELDGHLGRAVFRAVHRDPHAVLYWHLDDVFLGSTTLFHEQRIVAPPGPHTLVLVDRDGQRVERRFRVADPVARAARSLAR